MSFQLPTYFYCLELWLSNNWIKGSVDYTSKSKLISWLAFRSSPPHKAVALLSWHQHNTMGKECRLSSHTASPCPLCPSPVICVVFGKLLDFSKYQFSVTISRRLQILLEKLQDIFLILIV